MKYGNKKIIIPIVLSVVMVFVLSFAIGFINTDDGFESEIEQPKANKVDRPLVSEETEEKEEPVSYYLVEEDAGKIKLYFVEGEEAVELKSEEISLEVLPKDDITMLSEGIKTQTADEALEVWENFIS